MSSIIRSIEGAVIDSSAKRRTVRAVWSDDSTDHYRTAFVQQGIDTATFRANPVILYEHGVSAERGTLPIANAVEWGVEKYKGKNALIGSARFWDDQFSEQRFQDYAGGRLKGWSIRLIPTDASPPTPQERRARPDWAQADMVYRAGTLAEVSCVSLPGNPNTLTLSVERSGRGMGEAQAKREMAEFRSMLGRLRSEMGARMDKALESMSLEELQAEFTLNRWKRLVEKQRQDEADKLYYASVAGQKDSYRRG